MECFARKIRAHYQTAALKFLMFLACVVLWGAPAEAFDVTINNPGNGSGSINDGVVCTIGPAGQCVGNGLSGSINLHADADWKSVFAGWGSPCNTSGDCVLSADTVIDARFNLNYRVGVSHNIGPTFATITDAYASFNDSGRIWATAETFSEDVVLDKAIFIFLVGGCSGGYPVTGATTTLQTLDASVGSVQVENFIVSSLVISGGAVEAYSLTIQ